MSGAVRPVEATHGALLRRAVPLTLANVTTPLLGLVDTIVIGRLGEAQPLAAVAAASTVFSALFWLFLFLRMSSAGLIAQAIGAGDEPARRLILARALTLAVALGVALAVLQAPIAAIAFALLDAGPGVTAEARAYYDIRIWSAPFALINFVTLGALVGAGRARLGLLVQVLLNGVNTALTLAFVAGLGLGVAGAALGALIAEAAAALVGLSLLPRVGLGFAAPAARLFDAAAWRRMAAINRDIMLRSAALLFAISFFTAQGARAGEVTLAANAVLMNLFMVATYFLDGFALAVEQMVGQSVGAGDERGFRRSVRVAAVWCGAAGLAAMAAIGLGGTALIDFVSTNAQVRAAARADLVFAALAPPAGAASFLFDGVYVGAVWTRELRDLMLLAVAIYLAAWAALAGYGNAGLWGALLVLYAARGALQAWRYPALARRTFAA